MFVSQPPFIRARVFAEWWLAPSAYTVHGVEHDKLLVTIRANDGLKLQDIIDVVGRARLRYNNHTKEELSEEHDGLYLPTWRLILDRRDSQGNWPAGAVTGDHYQQQRDLLHPLPPVDSRIERGRLEKFLS